MPILVNGELIDDSVVSEEMAAMRPRYEEAMSDMDPLEREIQLKDWARENVIERTLLRQVAMRDPELACGGEGEEEVAQRIQRLFHRITSSVPLPKPKEISEYYRKHKHEMRTPELVHAAHIVKNIDEENTEEQALAAITKIQEQLDAGADFFEVADEHSDCPGGGGDLGWFPRGQMVEEFEEVVFALQPGERSGIFRTAFGYHIAYVIDRRPEGIAEFPDVRDRIEALLLEQKRQQAVESYLDELRAKADVQIIKSA
jgi:parvulin-like peptidyl-prolyl isomerase